MSSGSAPFGTDLQPECTMKVVGGKLVRVPIVPSSLLRRTPSVGAASSGNNFLRWPDTTDDRVKLGSLREPSLSRKVNHRRSFTTPLPTSSPTSVQMPATLPPISEATPAGRPAASVGLHNIVNKLKRVHRCSSKVDDVLMFSRGLDRLQTGSVTAAELHRLLHCCCLHLEDDVFTTLVEASGAGADKSGNSSNKDTLVNYRMFCNFLKDLVSSDSPVTDTVRENKGKYTLHGHGLRPGNVERPKHQRVHHSSPARLLVSRTRPQAHLLHPFGTSEAERGVLSQDTARLLVKVEHTLRDAGWGLDSQFHQMEQALAAKDRERTGYLSMEDVEDACSEEMVPLSRELLASLMWKCISNETTKLVRWIAFTDLLQKAKPLKLYKSVDPVFRRKPVLGKISEDQEEGSRRLPKADSGTVHHYNSDLAQRDLLDRDTSTGKEVSDVLPLVKHALCACADNEGYLYLDEALRIIRIYSQVHQISGALHVDRVWQRYRDRCVVQQGSLLIHTQDALDCLSDCL